MKWDLEKTALKNQESRKIGNKTQGRRQEAEHTGQGHKKEQDNTNQEEVQANQNPN